MASYAMLTNVGRNKEAAALANATPLAITEIAWGDGARIPAGGETALENEQGRKPVVAQGVTGGALNTAFFEILLTEDEGPFVIREAGLFDADGDMIAVAHYDPPVNKPLTTVSAHLRINVVFSDLENLVIQIDASTAFASVERTLTAGDGLIGGGDLTENRMFALAPEVIDALNRPINVTILRSGANAIYVTPPGCKALHVKGVGGGGGGDTPELPPVGQRRYGWPGGGGAGFESWLTPDPLQEYYYTVGAGGAGGGNTNGTRGGHGGWTSFGDTTFDGGTTIGGPSIGGPGPNPGSNYPGMVAYGGRNNVVGKSSRAFGGEINYPGVTGRQHFSIAPHSGGPVDPISPGGSIFGPSNSLSEHSFSAPGEHATVPGTGGAAGIIELQDSFGTTIYQIDTEGKDGADGIIVITEFY